jgi:hypothetical protein
MVERICIIALASLLMFYRTLKYHFVCDDIPVSMQAPKPKNVFHRILIQLNCNGHYQPQEAHFITILLHTLTCIFIYLGLGKNDVSFLTAILFCLNPRNNQCSIWISGRSGYLIPTLLLMMSMTIPWLAPLFLYRVTVQATAFFAPFGFLGSPSWWFIWFMPVLWFIHFNQFKKQVKNKMDNDSVKGDKKLEAKKLIIAIKTYGFYFFMCFVPNKVSFYHSFMQSAAGSGNALMNKRAYALDKVFWFGLFVIIFFPSYAIIHGWDGICWGVWWFSVCIVPYLNFIRVQQEISERYVYCANVGLMYVLACAILSYPFLIVFFLTLYAVRLWWVMPMYKDDYSMVEYAVLEDPDCWFAWHLRAVKRFDSGGITGCYNMESFIFWSRCLMISPQEFKTLINVAISLRIMKKFQESNNILAEAEKNIVPGQEESSKKIITDVRNGRNFKGDKWTGWVNEFGDYCPILK